MASRTVLPATFAALLVLAGCAPAADRDDGELRIVASTDVYGDVAARIAGDLAGDVTSLVSGVAQDPHAYEASARDRLAVTRADVIVGNGGGYDPFLDDLVEVSGEGAVVIRAVDVAGPPPIDDRPGGEHLWYDPGAMRAVAVAIAGALSAADPGNAEAYAGNLAAFEADLDALDARIAGIRAAVRGRGVAVTEPLPLALLAAAGFADLTPAGFAEAVEDGREVPPLVLRDMLDLVRSGELALLAGNAQTTSPETDDVIAAARAAGLPVVLFTETLPEGAGYVDWMAGNLSAIEEALSG